ncbi:MAG: hypothetical protein IKH38_01945 [Clostridia bacterium]|nr:hypothetical protein [Clostridia bacterium]
MKKFVALLLAAMMLLVSVSALAEGTTVKESPNSGNINTAENPFFDIVTEPGTKAQEIIEKIGNGEDVVNLVSSETAEQIKNVVGEDAAVQEIISLDFHDWTPEDGAQKVEIEFATEYKAGEPIVAVLGLVTGDEVEEYILEAEVVEDYVILVKFPVSVLEKAMTADELYILFVNANEAPADAIEVDPAEETVEVLVEQ